MREYGMASPGWPAPAALGSRLGRAQAGRHRPAAMAPLKPWLVALALGVHEFARLGYRAELAVDAHWPRRRGPATPK
jgi:hypothetical protein